MKDDKQESAYPHFITDQKCAGLTKREYFAGMALQGLMAQGSGIGSNIWKGSDVSKIAYECADAMLEASKE